MSNLVRIGILGDFNPEFRSHHATGEALQHAARKLEMKVEFEWIPTSSLTSAGVDTSTHNSAPRPIPANADHLTWCHFEKREAVHDLCTLRGASVSINQPSGPNLLPKLEKRPNYRRELGFAG